MTGVQPGEIVFWVAAACLTAAATMVLMRRLRPKDRATRILATVIVAFLPLASLGLYAALGRPELTAWRTRPVLPPFIAGAVEKLAADTVAHPDDAQAWVLLGDVDAKVRHYEEAEAAYRKALALSPADASLKIAIARTMLARDGDAVTPDIATLLAADPGSDASRYYLALAKSQAADWPGALADWQALRATLPPDSALAPSVDARIDQAKRVTGLIEDH